tara:strand:- start:953 stop:1321 length:369 start_codon:yes stop_codon:yes gene_type:complete
VKNYDNFDKFEKEICGKICPQDEHAKRVIELIEECMNRASKSRAIQYWIIDEAFKKGMEIVQRYDNSFHDYSPTFWKTVRESMEEKLDTYYDCGRDVECECESDYNDDGLCTTDPSDRNYRM